MPYAQIGSNIERERDRDKFGDAICLSADGSIVAIDVPIAIKFPSEGRLTDYPE